MCPDDYKEKSHDQRGKKNNGMCVKNCCSAQLFTCESRLSGGSLIARYNDFIVLVPGEGAVHHLVALHLHGQIHLDAVHSRGVAAAK